MRSKATREINVCGINKVAGSPKFMTSLRNRKEDITSTFIQWVTKNSSFH